MRRPHAQKRWAALALAAACLLPTAPILAGSAAADPGTLAAPASSASQSPETLTLAKAIEIALASNHDLAMLRIDMDTADTNGRLVKAQVKEIDGDDIESVDAAKQKYYNEAQIEATKKINQLSLKAAESEAKLEVQKRYYACINAQKEVELQEQSLQRAETNLSMVKAKLEAGAAAKTDVTQAEVSVQNAKASLESAQNGLKAAWLNLNHYLGVDLTKSWKLEDSTQLLKPDITSLEQALDLALKQRYEIQQSQEEEKLAELTVELYSKYSILSSYQGKIARNQLEKAKANVEETKRSIMVEVMQAFDNLQSSKTNMETYEKAKELAAENYRAMKIRYENGLATSYEVVEVEEAYTKSENQYNEAVKNYNIAVLTLQNAVGE
jgi:outer membrane protein TolC